MYDDSNQSLLLILSPLICSHIASTNKMLENCLASSSKRPAYPLHFYSTIAGINKHYHNLGKLIIK